MLVGQPGCDQRTVAGARITLDAEQGGGRVSWEQGCQRVETGGIEDLLGVTPDVLRRQLDPRALADPLAPVCLVLKLAQLGRRRELLAVFVLDPGLRERRLQPARVGPGVLRTAHAAALPNVQHRGDVGIGKRCDEGLGGETVDADGRDRGHRRSFAVVLVGEEVRVHRGDFFGEPLAVEQLLGPLQRLAGRCGVTQGARPVGDRDPYRPAGGDPPQSSAEALHEGLDSGLLLAADHRHPKLHLADPPDPVGSPNDARERLGGVLERDQGSGRARLVADLDPRTISPGSWSASMSSAASVASEKLWKRRLISGNSD